MEQEADKLIIQIQFKIPNCLLVNQRAQVLPMYKNNTQQYKHTQQIIIYVDN